MIIFGHIVKPFMQYLLHIINKKDQALYDKRISKKPRNHTRKTFIIDKLAAVLQLW